MHIKLGQRDRLMATQKDRQFMFKWMLHCEFVFILLVHDRIRHLGVELGMAEALNYDISRTRLFLSVLRAGLVNGLHHVNPQRETHRHAHSETDRERRRLRERDRERGGGRGRPRQTDIVRRKQKVRQIEIKKPRQREKTKRQRDRQTG